MEIQRRYISLREYIIKTYCYRISSIGEEFLFNEILYFPTDAQIIECAKLV